MDQRDERTQTSAFGVGRREGHDASAFYARFAPPEISDDEHVNRPAELIEWLGTGRLVHGSSVDMTDLPDSSVALVVTSPPYFVGKEYELAVTGELDTDSRVPATYLEFLELLHDVFAECRRVLEPGGRIAVNVANLGRKPYRSLSADVITILQDQLGLLVRGEVIWKKSETSSGSCAWGSFARASNPVLRDITERVIIASKGRFSRALAVKDRRRLDLPHESTLANDEFVDVTRDVWEIAAESATRIGHPAPFPVELPRRLIDLYTYRDDIVLDPFGGAGTTLVAAARTGRLGIGYDTDSSYIELAQRRLDAELDRVDRQRATLDQFVEKPLFELEQEVVNEFGQLSPEDRQEHFQARAVREGKKAQDIARDKLEAAGFAVDDKARHPSGILEFNFQVTSQNAGHQWWVDVSGAFTSSRPGLQRIDTVWKLLGRLHVLRMFGDGQERTTPGALVLTSNLPKPGSPGDRALREIGPDVLFDVIELFDPVGLERLRSYAEGADAVPLPGFWNDDELASYSYR